MFVYPVPAGCKPEKGEYLVSVPVLVAMKAVLHNAMIETGTHKAGLARSMNLKGPQVWNQWSGLSTS